MMRLKALTKQGGQTTLEAAVVSLALLLFTVLLLGLIYFCFLRTYLQFSSYEFLICRTHSDPWTCETKFRKEIQSLLIKGARIQMLWARKEGQNQCLTLKLNFTLLNKKIHWIHEDQLQWPLKVP